MSHMTKCDTGKNYKPEGKEQGHYLWESSQSNGHGLRLEVSSNDIKENIF